MWLCLHLLRRRSQMYGGEQLRSAEPPLPRKPPHLIPASSCPVLASDRSLEPPKRTPESFDLLAICPRQLVLTIAIEAMTVPSCWTGPRDYILPPG